MQTGIVARDGRQGAALRGVYPLACGTSIRASPVVPGATVEITIDVDGRLEAGDYGQAQVSGAGIAGAAITATPIGIPGGPKTATGMFGPDATARIRGRACVTS